MKRILFAMLCVGSLSANAASFEGNSAGIFVNATGTSSLVTQGVGTYNFLWGEPASATDVSSELFYKGDDFSVDENEAFVFGRMAYNNGTIIGGTGATSIDLNVALSFTTPSSLAEEFTFNLGLINTTNTSDPIASADYVHFDNSVPSSFFNIAGVDYTLEFLGFGSLAGGGFTEETSFHVFENEGASANLIGRITSTPGSGTPSVPEPSILFMLLPALGLLSLKQRKS